MFYLFEQLSHYRHCGCAFRRNLQQRSMKLPIPKTVAYYWYRDSASAARTDGIASRRRPKLGQPRWLIRGSNLVLSHPLPGREMSFFSRGLPWIINYYHEQKALSGIGNSSRLWCYGGRHSRGVLVRHVAGDSLAREGRFRSRGAGRSSGWSVAEWVQIVRLKPDLLGMTFGQGDGGVRDPRRTGVPDRSARDARVEGRRPSVRAMAGSETRAQRESTFAERKAILRCAHERGREFGGEGF